MSSSVICLPDLADIRRADRVRIAEIVRDLMSVANRCDALIGAAVSKVEAEGIKAVYECSSSGIWLDEVAQMGQAAANKIVARAHAVNPSYTLDGTEIPATAPLTGAAARCDQSWTRGGDREDDGEDPRDRVRGGPCGGGEDPG